MKLSFRNIALTLAAMAISACVTSCGDSKEKTQQMLIDAANAVDSILAPVADQSPIKAISSVAAEEGIILDIVLEDSTVCYDLIEPELINYYIARQIKTVGNATINQVTNALDKSNSKLKFAIIGSDDNLKEFSFTPAEIRNLYKAKGSQLNAPKVKEQIVNMFQQALPKNSLTAFADTTTLEVEGGFLTYNVEFPQNKYYSSNGQGLITGLYLEPIKASYAKFGVLEPSIIEMLKELGIDGVRVVFSAKNSDSQLKQAFPWRTITE